MKTAISLPDDLFSRIEQLITESGQSRSAFFAEAAERHLSALRMDTITTRINLTLERYGQFTDEGLLEAGRGVLADTSEDW